MTIGDLLPAALTLGMMKLWLDYRTPWIFLFAAIITLLDAAIDVWIDSSPKSFYVELLWSSAWVGFCVLVNFFLYWLIERYYPLREKHKEYKLKTPDSKSMF